MRVTLSESLVYRYLRTFLFLLTHVSEKLYSFNILFFVINWMLLPHMLHKVPLLRIRFNASRSLAGKWLYVWMLFEMDTQCVGSHKGFAANLAYVWSGSCMASGVLDKMALRDKCFITVIKIAFEGSGTRRSYDLRLFAHGSRIFFTSYSLQTCSLTRERSALKLF